MKKLVLFCLAAMLVIAFTLPAAAKTTMTSAGNIFFGGYYLSNPMASAVSSVRKASSYYLMDLQISFKFQINPQLYTNVQFAGVDKVWGTNVFSRYNSGAAVAHTHTDGAGLATTSSSFGINALEIEAANIVYLVYKGYVFVGLGKDGDTGAVGPLLRSKVGANRNWSSGEGTWYRIMTSQTFGPWSFLGFIQKLNESDMGTALNDNDMDGYYISGNYGWKTGKAYLSYWLGDYALFGFNNHSITGTIYQKLGDFTVGARTNWARNTFASGAPNKSGYYWWVTGEYATGPYKVGAMIAINDGVTPGSTTDMISGGPGTDFRGLYAAFGEYDGLMYDSTAYSGTSDYKTFGDGGAGLQLYYGFAEYKLMEKMWVMAALGFLRWDELPGAAAGKTTSRNYGSEIDLGMNYTIIKGLDLGVHFGYFIPGTFFAAGAKGNHIHLDWELKMKF